MQVKDLMNPSAVTVEPTSTAALAARLISRHNVGALPVCGPDRRLRGVVTDRDIILRCVAAEEDPAQTPVRDIMTRSCATVSPGDDCREATRLMALMTMCVKSGETVTVTVEGGSEEANAAALEKFFQDNL